MLFLTNRVFRRHSEHTLPIANHRNLTIQLDLFCSIARIIPNSEWRSQTTLVMAYRLFKKAASLKTIFRDLFNSFSTLTRQHKNLSWFHKTSISMAPMHLMLVRVSLKLVSLTPPLLIKIILHLLNFTVTYFLLALVVLFILPSFFLLTLVSVLSR